MTREEEIVNELEHKFPILEGKSTIKRARRIFIETDRMNAIDILEFSKKELGFDLLCTITGLDVGENLQFIYHIANKYGIIINLKTEAPKSDPKIKSVLEIYNGAVFYERELEDLLGAQVEGLPEGRHYPLPENWPKGQYPLRKDWKPENFRESKTKKE